MRCAAIAMVLIVMSTSTTAAQTPEERINRGLERAREAGIPVALLESKISEGKAKGVSMDRIATAVERRAAALERARTVLDDRRGIREADLGVAAEAIESGVSEAVLRMIAEAAPPDRRVVAIAALTQLVEQGHVPEAALQRVQEALKRGADALINLPAQAGGAAGRRGGTPGETSPGPGAGRGGPSAGPPIRVPAPGSPPQPAKPGSPPSTPGRPTTPPSGRGGSAL